MEIKLPIFNIQGSKVGDVSLDAEIFGIEPSKVAVHSVVRWQLAKRRAGTHMAKTRTQMKYGNTKPFKQKGTGRARQGSKISPLMRGGAVVHGPQPRDYEFRLNKGLKRLAMRSVLSEKVASGNFIVVDKMIIESGKTKEFCSSMKALGLAATKLAIVTPKSEDYQGTERSARNAVKTKLMNLDAVNVYDLLNAKKLVVDSAALEQLTERLKG